jgi:hypothetical protein
MECFMSSEPTDRQLKLLAAEDWRFFAIGPGGTGLMMLATTEKKSKLSRKTYSFGLPSAPALFLNLARNARDRRIALDLDAVFVEHPSPQGTWPENHEILFDYLQEFSAEVIFSFSALEAFANENVPATFVYQTVNTKREAVSLSASDIERFVSLDEKLKKVIPLAHGLKGIAGTKPWQDYKRLKEIRDRLVHLKSVDRKASGPEDQTIWGLMVSCSDVDFVDAAYSIIACFPTLIADRQWFKRAGVVLKKTP